MINLKRKRGFTLVELLAVILILSLIFLISFGIFKLSIDDVNNTIDSVEENIILTAANDYALEYRGSSEANGGKGWHEEVGDENNNGVEDISFCVSLDSLMQYGYYKNDDSNFDKHRNSKAVYFEIENGVTTSKIISLNDADGEKCEYFIKSSSFAEDTVKNNEVLINSLNNNDKELGRFKYDVDELNNNRFKLNMDFNLDINSDFGDVRPLNFVFILDSSASMFYEFDENGNDIINNQGYKLYGDCDSTSIRYYYARKSIANFSNSINADDSKFKGSKMALIEFGGKDNVNGTVKINKEFDVNPIKDDDFGCTNMGNTNLTAGIDVATKLINDKIIEDNDKKNTYVILLYDGTPSTYSRLKCDNKTYNILDENFDDIKDVYYDSYSKNVQGCLMTAHDVLNSERENDFKYSRKASAKSAEYLKNLGVNFITLGYTFYNYYDDMKILATQNDDLCIDISDENNYNFISYSDADGQKYCYYDSNTTNINGLLDGILKNISDYSSFLKNVNLIVEPVKDELTGVDLITFYDLDNNLVEDNIIKKEFNNFNDVDTVNYLDDYVFKVNDTFYDLMCGDMKTCSLKNVELFKVTLSYEYISNDEVIKKDLVVPKFDLELEIDEKIN